MMLWRIVTLSNTNTVKMPAPLKLRPYGTIQICSLLLLSLYVEAALFGFSKVTKLIFMFMSASTKTVVIQRHPVSTDDVGWSLLTTWRWYRSILTQLMLLWHNIIISAECVLIMIHRAILHGPRSIAGIVIVCASILRRFLPVLTDRNWWCYLPGVKNPILIADSLLRTQMQGEMSLGRIPPRWDCTGCSVIWICGPLVYNIQPLLTSDSKCLVAKDVHIYRGACNLVNLYARIVPSVLYCCWLGDRKGIRPARKQWCEAGVVICLEQDADLHTAQLMPLPLTVICFCKIQGPKGFS